MALQSLSSVGRCEVEPPYLPLPAVRAAFGCLTKELLANDFHPH